MRDDPLKNMKHNPMIADLVTFPNFRPMTQALKDLAQAGWKPRPDLLAHSTLAADITSTASGCKR